MTHRRQGPTDRRLVEMGRQRSGDSSYFSTTGASPLGQTVFSPPDRYYTCADSSYDSEGERDRRAATPRHRHTGSQGYETSVSEKKPYQCLFPQCLKSFDRSADLDRHQKQVHLSNGVKAKYGCDYRRCPRKNDHFHRKDHFRDHLRDYHKEDLFKRGGGSTEAWLKERNIAKMWWRCSHCLMRVDKSRWECPGCKYSCEQDRRRWRDALWGTK